MMWRATVKPDPVSRESDDGMVLIPGEVMKVFGWKVGTRLKMESQDGHLIIKHYRRPSVVDEEGEPPT